MQTLDHENMTQRSLDCVVCLRDVHFCIFLKIKFESKRFKLLLYNCYTHNIIVAMLWPGRHTHPQEEGLSVQTVMTFVHTMNII